jgi:hypothetical protein
MAAPIRNLSSLSSSLSKPTNPSFSLPKPSFTLRSNQFPCFVLQNPWNTEKSRTLNKKKPGVRKNGEIFRWFTETKNQGRRAMGLRGLEVRETWFWGRERERWACGFEREEEGKRDSVGVGSHERR